MILCAQLPYNWVFTSNDWSLVGRVQQQTLRSEFSNQALGSMPSNGLQCDSSGFDYGCMSPMLCQKSPLLMGEDGHGQRRLT